MKNFILLICSFLFFVELNGSDDHSFKKKTLQESIRDHIENSTSRRTGKILLVGFESEQPITESHDTIVAFNQSLDMLKVLKEYLNPDGILYVFYMPLESHHWRITEEIDGEEATINILDRNAYYSGLEKLGMNEVGNDFYKGLAYYSSLNALKAEFITKPSIWHVTGELNLPLSYQPRWSRKGYCLISNEESVVGYYLYEFVFVK